MKKVLFVALILVIVSCSDQEYDRAMMLLKEGKISEAQKTFESVKDWSENKLDARKKVDSINLLLLKLKIQKLEEMQNDEIDRVHEWNMSLISNQQFLKKLTNESKRVGSFARFELDRNLTGVLIIHRKSDLRPIELSDLSLESYLLAAGTNETEIKTRGFNEVRIYTTSSRNMADYKTIWL